MRSLGRAAWFLTAAFVLGVVVYRLSPALSGAPVFSIDAWPLLSDSSYIMSHGSAQLLPCSGLPSCYLASWPGLVLLTAAFSRVTSISLYWSAPVITAAASLLSVLAIVLLAGLISERARLPAALLAFTAAPLNFFYSGYKEEMLAVSMLAVLMYVVAKEGSAPGDGRVRPAALEVSGVLMVGVIDTHHFTTFIMVAALVSLYLYSVGFERGRRLRPRVGWFALLAVALALGYYALQGFAPLFQSGYNLSFVATAVSYDVVLALGGWLFLTNRLYARLAPFVAGGVVLAGLLALPFLLRGLYVSSAPSEELMLLSLLPLFIIVVATELVVRSHRFIAGALVAWSVAPLSFGFFSLLDQNSVDVYRGLVAFLVPAVVLCAGAMVTGGAKGEGPGRRRTALLVVLLVSAALLGAYAEAQPLVQGRDIADGSTWYYPLADVGQVALIQSLVPQGPHVYADLPTASLYSFLDGAGNVTGAVLGSFGREASGGGVLVLSSIATNSFFFEPVATLQVTRTSLAGSDVVFNSPSYAVYTGP